MLKREIILSSLLLLLSIIIIVLSFSNVIKSALLSYLIFLPVILLFMASILRLISVVVTNFQSVKYSPPKFSIHETDNKHYFNYSSIQSFEGKLLSDGFDKSVMEANGQRIRWYKREQMQKTKLNYRLIIVENVTIVEMQDDFHFETMLEELDLKYKKHQCSPPKAPPKVLSTVFFITGQDLSFDCIENLVKQIQYFRPMYYLTVVLNEKMKIFYRSEIPNKKETQVLLKLVNTYFS